MTLSVARVLAAGGRVDDRFAVKASPYAPGPISSRWFNSQPEVEVKGGVDYSDGIMIALMIPDTLAESIALPDGQPAAELHITLAYLGSTSDVDDDSDYLLQVLTAVRDVAAEQKPLSGMLSGIGRFTGEKLDPFYLSADIPGLFEFRYKLVEALDDTDAEVDKEHGYTPHVTLAYISPDTETPMRRATPRPVEFSDVTIVYGTNEIPVAFGGDKAEETDTRMGTGDPLPTTTSATVNGESKTSDERAPRD